MKAKTKSKTWVVPHEVMLEKRIEELERELEVSMQEKKNLHEFADKLEAQVRDLLAVVAYLESKGEKK
jgi:cbb3-type cytochrome oxidase cytochrome c subunit